MNYLDFRVRSVAQRFICFCSGRRRPCVGPPAGVGIYKRAFFPTNRRRRLREIGIANRSLGARTLMLCEWLSPMAETNSPGRDRPRLRVSRFRPRFVSSPPPSFSSASAPPTPLTFAAVGPSRPLAVVILATVFPGLPRRTRRPIRILRENRRPALRRTPFHSYTAHTGRGTQSPGGDSVSLREPQPRPFLGR